MGFFIKTKSSNMMGVCPRCHERYIWNKLSNSLPRFEDGSVICPKCYKKFLLQYIPILIKRPFTNEEEIEYKERKKKWNVYQDYF